MTDAIDELRAASYWNGGGTNSDDLRDYVVCLADAERIITAQEQRLGELEGNLDWTRKQRDQYDLMSIKLCEERDVLLEKVEQQEQRIAELRFVVEEIIRLDDEDAGLCANDGLDVVNLINGARAALKENQ